MRLRSNSVAHGPRAPGTGGLAPTPANNAAANATADAIDTIRALSVGLRPQRTNRTLDPIEGRVDWLGCCLGGDLAAERQVLRHLRRAARSLAGMRPAESKVRSPAEWIEGEEVPGE